MASRAFSFVLLLASSGCSAPIKPRFERSTDASSRAGVQLTPNGQALAGNEAGDLALFGSNGERLWKVAAGREIASRPAVVGPFAVAGTVAGELISVRLDTGEVAWRLSNLPPIFLPLASDESHVFVQASDGSVRAISAATGETQWARSPPEKTPESTWPLYSLAPKRQGPLLVFSERDLTLTALKIADGSTVWRKTGLRMRGFDLGEGFVSLLQSEAASSRSAQTMAWVETLKLEDGEPLWKTALPSSPNAGPFACGQWVLVALDKPMAGIGFDSKTGQSVWQAAVPGPWLGAPVCWRDYLLIPSAGARGVVSAFRPPEAVLAFTATTHSPLRTGLALHEDALFLQALDGRVMGFTLAAPK